MSYSSCSLLDFHPASDGVFIFEKCYHFSSFLKKKPARRGAVSVSNPSTISFYVLIVLMFYRSFSSWHIKSASFHIFKGFAPKCDWVRQNQMRPLGVVVSTATELGVTGQLASVPMLPFAVPSCQINQTTIPTYYFKLTPKRVAFCFLNFCIWSISMRKLIIIPDKAPLSTPPPSH